MNDIDKDLFNTIKKIRKYCMLSTCDMCLLAKDTEDCKVVALIQEIKDKAPDYWNMKEIERIINE